LEAAAPDRSQSAPSSKVSSRDTSICLKLLFGVSSVEGCFWKMKMQKVKDDLLVVEVVGSIEKMCDDN